MRSLIIGGVGRLVSKRSDLRVVNRHVCSKEKLDRTTRYYSIKKLQLKLKVFEIEMKSDRKYLDESVAYILKRIFRCQNCLLCSIRN